MPSTMFTVVISSMAVAAREGFFGGAEHTSACALSCPHITLLMMGSTASSLRFKRFCSYLSASACFCVADFGRRRRCFGCCCYALPC